MRYRTLQWMMALCAVWLFSGCGPAPDSCEYWKEKLSKMDKLDKAVREVGDKKCKGVFAELEKVWDAGQYRDRILQAVKKINDPAGSQKLIAKSLGDTRSGAIAAYLVRDWKLKGVIPQLKKVIRDDSVEPFVKSANLKALLSFGKQAQEDFLIEVLKTNPEKQGIQLNSIAARTLGEMKSEKSIPFLINGLFMSKGKKNIYGETSLGLVNMSSKAAPWIIKSLEGKNPILLAHAKKHRIYSWVVTWKLAVVARDMKQKVFGPHLWKLLNTPFKLDKTLRPAARATHEQVWLSTLTTAAVGLAYLGDTSYIPKLKEKIKDKDLSVRIRLQMMVALTHLGGPATAEYIADLIRGLRAKNPKKDRKFRTLRFNMFGPLAKVADHEGAKIGRKLIEEEKDKEVKRGMLSAEPLLEIGEFCKDDVACWKKLLYFDVDTDRITCRKSPKECPVKTLLPQERMKKGRKAFMARGEACKADRACWVKLFKDVVSSDAFSRGMARWKKVLLKLKRGKKPVSEKGQASLKRWMAKLPIQLRMTKKEKEEFRHAIREKAALILAFSKKRTEAVDALRAFLSHKDALVRDMVLFGLERHRDKGAIPLLKKQIAKEKGKREFVYIGDRMQLLIYRLEQLDGKAPAPTPAPKKKPTKKKTKKRKKKKK